MRVNSVFYSRVSAEIWSEYRWCVWKHHSKICAATVGGVRRPNIPSVNSDTVSYYLSLTTRFKKDFEIKSEEKYN